ncbi:ABC transporter substrate-binding protein [Aerococcaceae bacterium DSM 111176]|nr:ABC transporter substrate-binding protein [Aerococcaceae bacterium DSM 111176]
MKKLIKVISLLVALFPLLTIKSAQAQENITVGIVTMMSHPSLDLIRDGVYEGLENGGYIEGENMEVLYHNVEGDINMLGMVTDEVISQDPDIIFAISTPVAQAFQNATDDIPVILTGVRDPEDAGLVESYENPGGNMTGVSHMTPHNVQFELIQQFNPEAKTIGMIYTTSEDNSVAEVEQAEAVANEMGFDFVSQGISSTNDMQMVAQSIASEVDVIFAGNDNTIASAFDTLAEVADGAGVPIITTVEEMVGQGALAGLVLSQKDIGIQNAEYGIEILEGADPATLPIKFMDNYLFVYNGNTAETLGIELPETLTEDGIDLSE